MRGTSTMTQDEFAAELKQYYTKPVKESKKGKEEDEEISKSTVSTWENGVKTPPLHDNEFVEAIAKVFSVSVADVLKGSGYDLGPAYESELDEQRRILLEAYDSGDLARLVRIALEAHDKRGQLYSRLESKEDTNTSEGEGSTATTSGRR
jgi:transcriptional regulator with XRE-family HTH domain